MDYKISVIIRTYNEEEKLPEVLKALKNQIYKNYEIIVVDSESTDQTISIAQKYNCTIVKITKADFNYSYASNMGAKYSSGDILCYLSGHSIPLTNQYLNIINNVFQDKNVGGGYGDTLALKDGSLIEKVFNFLSHIKHKFKGNLIEKKIHQGILSCSNGFVRKEIWKKHPFSEEIKNGGEDVYMAYKIIKEGYYIMRIPSVIVRHSHRKGYRKFKLEMQNWKKQYDSVCEIIREEEEK